MQGEAKKRAVRDVQLLLRLLRAGRRGTAVPRLVKEGAKQSPNLKGELSGPYCPVLIREVGAFTTLTGGYRLVPLRGGRESAADFWKEKDSLIRLPSLRCRYGQAALLRLTPRWRDSHSSTVASPSANGRRMSL